MFIDELTIHAKAGKGGPSGGNGGKGGDVYTVAVRDIGILNAYKNVKSFEAGDGASGMKALKQGGEGQEIEIKLPIGSRITNLESKHSFELLNEGERILLL